LSLAALTVIISAKRRRAREKWSAQEPVSISPGGGRIVAALHLTALPWRGWPVIERCLIGAQQISSIPLCLSGRPVMAATLKAEYGTVME
jgi:hypothetical protein